MASDASPQQSYTVTVSKNVQMFKLPILRFSRLTSLLSKITLFPGIKKGAIKRNQIRIKSEPNTFAFTSLFCILSNASRRQGRHVQPRWTQECPKFQRSRPTLTIPAGRRKEREGREERGKRGKREEEENREECEDGEKRKDSRE